MTQTESSYLLLRMNAASASLSARLSDPLSFPILSSTTGTSARNSSLISLSMRSFKMLISSPRSFLHRQTFSTGKLVTVLILLLLSAPSWLVAATMPMSYMEPLLERLLPRMKLSWSVHSQSRWQTTMTKKTLKSIKMRNTWPQRNLLSSLLLMISKLPRKFLITLSLTTKWPRISSTLMNSNALLLSL